MKPVITVFTPTYNRAYILDRLYKSLCRQTNGNFAWLIIDDGSVDNTKSLVDRWIKESKIKIQYYFKENGGMHTAHNLAYSLINTELNVCIDSDDFMPNNAVENILKLWSKHGNEKLAGIIGLDTDLKGNIIGSAIPKNVKQGTLPDLYSKYKAKGDKKIILRTDIVKKYPPYPEFKSEKLVPLGILYLQIAQDYECLYSNEVFCVVDYQEGGSSKTIFNQYKQSPNGFAYSRKIYISNSKSIVSISKCYIHLISSSFYAKKPKLAFEGVNPFLTLFFYPLGVFFHIYLRIKIKQ